MQRPNLQVLRDKMNDAATFHDEYRGDMFSWEKESGLNFSLEWCDHEFKPAARIYHKGERKNAYYLIDVDKPKPWFLNDNQWEAAKEMQRREDAKDF